MSEGPIDLSQTTPLVHDEESGVSPEQLAALLGAPDERPEPSELELALAGGLREVTIPVTIYLEDGRVFLVDDVRAWGWSPFGAYCVGRFEDDPEDVERHRLFSGARIKEIELQTEAYEAFVENVAEANEATAEEEAPGDEPEPESPSD